MSESKLESRLSELKLAAPSEELDQLVLAHLSQRSQPASNMQSPERPQTSETPIKHRKPFLPAAIAAALLIGSVAGFLIGQPTNRSAGNALAGFNPTLKRPQPASMKSHKSKATITSQLAGPNVSAVCALVNFDNLPQTPHTECQDCHSGLAESINSFQKSHLLLAEFATCSLCHGVDVSLKSTATEAMF